MIYSAQMHWKGIQRELKGWLWLLGREKCFIMETATVPLKPNSLTKADFKLIQFFQDPRTKFFNIYFEKKKYLI